jgi:hypothetical protein
MSETHEKIEQIGKPRTIPTWETLGFLFLTIVLYVHIQYFCLKIKYRKLGKNLRQSPFISGSYSLTKFLLKNAIFFLPIFLANAATHHHE